MMTVGRVQSDIFQCLIDLTLSLQIPVDLVPPLSLLNFSPPHHGPR